MRYGYSGAVRDTCAVNRSKTVGFVPPALVGGQIHAGICYNSNPTNSSDSTV